MRLDVIFIPRGGPKAIRNSKNPGPTTSNPLLRRASLVWGFVPVSVGSRLSVMNFVLVIGRAELN